MKTKRILRALAHGMGMRFLHPRRVDLGAEVVIPQDQVAPPAVCHIERRGSRLRGILASVLPEDHCDIWLFDRDAEKPTAKEDLKKEITEFIFEHKLSERTAPPKWIE